MLSKFQKLEHWSLKEDIKTVLSFFCLMVWAYKFGPAGDSAVYHWDLLLVFKIQHM